MTMGIEDRLKDPKFINWIKEYMALELVREAFLDTVEEKLQTFHKELLSKSLPCGECSIQPECNNCVWVTEIINLTSPSSHCLWKNTDMPKWETDYWELAKIWISHITDENTGPATTDCTKILQLCKNCTLFNVGEDENDRREALQKVIAIRNKLCHSIVSEVAQGVLDEDFDAMMQLLSTKCLPVEEAADARKKLEELQSESAFTIDQAVSVLEETRKTILYAVEAHRQDYQELKDDIRGIKTILEKRSVMSPYLRDPAASPGSKDGQYMKLLNREFDKVNVKHKLVVKDKELQDKKPKYKRAIEVTWEISPSQAEEQQTKVDEEKKLAKEKLTGFFPNNRISVNDVSVEEKEKDNDCPATLKAKVSVVASAKLAKDAKENVAKECLEKLGLLEMSLNSDVGGERI